jgi:two-component system chemotaxis sensor kinase CheA
LKRLSKLGNILELKPPMEELRAGRIPEGAIRFELETGLDERAVRTALANVTEMELVSLDALERAAAAPKRAPAPGPPALPNGSGSPGTVRIKTELLDYFLDTVGELILATSQIREIGKALPLATRPQLEEGVDRLHGLVKDLYDKVMSARMTPLSTVTDRLPRTVRDIARRREREVELVVTGAEVELDRTILENLSEPILHLLRNCIDHGIESAVERGAAGKTGIGRVSISVRRERDRVALEIEDNGRGMDPQKLRQSAVAKGLLSEEVAARLSDKEALALCFLPGVSTARDVSDISGRGVGMDAVKRSLEEVGGTIEIHSERGVGTRFTLHLPLTVSVVNLMLVGVGREIVGFPVLKVLSALELDSREISKNGDGSLLAHSQGLLPVHLLSELLGFPASEARSSRPYIVIEGDRGKVALAVDRLLGQEEAVLKTLTRPLDLVPGVSGVTILGTGRPVFILDVPRLLAS